MQMKIGKQKRKTAGKNCGDFFAGEQLFISKLTGFAVIANIITEAEPCRHRVISAHGTDRMRQKLLDVETGVFVKTTTPSALAALVACGTQSGAARLKVRSRA